MTFIASVKARNGVAIIADSLVSTSVPVITVNSFERFLNAQATDDISVEAIAKLFEHQTHHTNDYEDKLVKYDKYTAITTAGSARIGGKRISDVIHDKIKNNGKLSGYDKMTIKQKTDDFEKHIKKVIRATGQKKPIDTDIIFTHYNTKQNITEIIQMQVLASMVNNRYQTKCKQVTFPDNMKVVLDGQNHIASTLLYGCAIKAQDLQRAFIEDFIKKAKIRIAKKRKEAVLSELRSGIYKSFPTLLDELQAFKIRDLSLQEAVNLSYLLLKVEMDFQKYTQDIPTIGGVIKLATISSDGYNMICGDKTISPV